MVLKPGPIFAAVESLTGARRNEDVSERQRVVLLSPQGGSLRKPSPSSGQIEQVVLICGRYEGVDSEFPMRSLLAKYPSAITFCPAENQRPW
jgi:tRNA (guanine37-N1)-methyltransferase